MEKRIKSSVNHMKMVNAVDKYTASVHTTSRQEHDKYTASVHTTSRQEHDALVSVSAAVIAEILGGFVITILRGYETTIPYSGFIQSVCVLILCDRYASRDRVIMLFCQLAGDMLAGTELLCGSVSLQGIC